MQSAEHMADVAVGDHDGGAGFPSLAHERVVVATAFDGDPLPRVALGGPPAARDPVERAGEVIGKAQQELLGRSDAAARECEHGVLLRVGGHDVAVVAREVGGREIPAQLRRDAEILDLVAGVVARDLHDPHLGLAVLVGTQDDAHQLPRYVE